MLFWLEMHVFDSSNEKYCTIKPRASNSNIHSPSANNNPPPPLSKHILVQLTAYILNSQKG